jgi:hypothetical protein
VTTVPEHLVPVLDAYRTCELLTVGRDGTPVAWPTVSVYDPQDGTFLITTSIALPQKAYNVRRDPRVALLFSDPTASGLDAPPQILVQGTAVCPDEIVTEVGARAELWRRLYERQPVSKAYSANGLSRRLMDWYYMRLVITVTPTAVRTRPALRTDGALTAPAVPRGADGAYAATARRLPGFTSAVLAGYDAAGLPTLVRVRPAAAGGVLSFDVPPGEEPAPGRAALLCHSHDERLWNLQSFVVAGDLAGAGATWRLTPARYIPGGGDTTGPLAVIAELRKLRRTAAGYLDRRGLARPSIPWREYDDVKAAPGPRQPAGR